MQGGNRMDQILYHYTDFISFDGILKGRELRVNNVLNMNDAMEMELFMSGIFKAVEKRFSETEDERIIAQIDKMIEAIRSRVFDFSLYAACFSELRDDAAQWERYANRGKGVCLCFRKDELKKMTGGALSLQKVFYKDNMDNHPLVDRIYDFLKEDYQENTEPHPAADRTYRILKENIDLDDSPEMKKAAYEVWKNSASFKHPSFASEHEIRLILMPFEVSDSDLKPRYHVAKDRIKKYYPLDLDRMCRKAEITIEDLIAGVITGPESTQSMPILRDYLRDMGLDRLAEHIYSSDCPLRSKL